MFCNMHSLTGIDLSSFDTSKVTEMSSLFESSYNLVSINVNGQNISSASNSRNLFYRFSNPQLVVKCDQGGSPGTGSCFGKQCSQ